MINTWPARTRSLQLMYRGMTKEEEKEEAIRINEAIKNITECFE